MAIQGIFLALAISFVFCFTLKLTPFQTGIFQAALGISIIIFVVMIWIWILDG